MLLGMRSEPVERNIDNAGKRCESGEVDLKKKGGGVDLASETKKESQSTITGRQK